MIQLKALAAGIVAFTLTGCTASFQQSALVPAPAAATPITGSVHGGQQPITGAVIQLYAASTAGYSAAATPLLTVPVVTTFGGNFSITNDYTCPSSTTQVYLTATGGNPGLGTGVLNPQSALIAALGSCGNLSASTFIVINEVTTVAAVWALAPFMTDITHVGTSATNVIGLQNAFVSAAQLADISHGTAPGALPVNAIGPVYATNTLANILSACVNSSGGTAGDTTNCGKLLSYATPAGATAPTNTVTAAVNLAQHPGLNVAKLFALSSASPAFLPAYATAPNDLTLGIAYPGLSPTYNARHLAVDNAQNVWFITNSGIAYISNDGSTLTSVYKPASLSPFSIAIDPGGFLWIGEDKTVLSGQNTLSYCGTKINAVGFDLYDVPCPTTTSTNGIATSTYPGGISAGSTLTAVGPSSEVWFPTKTLAELTGGGAAVTPNGVTVTNAPTIIGGASGGGFAPYSAIEGFAIDPRRQRLGRLDQLQRRSHSL